MKTNHDNNAARMALVNLSPLEHSWPSAGMQNITGLFLGRGCGLSEIKSKQGSQVSYVAAKVTLAATYPPSSRNRCSSYVEQVPEITASGSFPRERGGGGSRSTLTIKVKGH